VIFKHMKESVRKPLLNHIHRLNASRSSDCVIVFSDMDDTLVSTFKDRRFPFNTLYPGVKQFYHELVCSKLPPDTIMNWARAKDRVTFVTARPSWLNTWTRSELIKHGFKTSVALTGTSTSFITPAQMLARKAKQCSEYHCLFPECTFFLVGDSGQRDIDLGKVLLSKGLVDDVFIHDIFEPVAPGEPELVDHEAAGRTVVNSVASIARSVSIKNDHVYTEPQEGLHSGISRAKSQEDLTTMHVMQSVPSGYRHVECAAHNITMFGSYAGAALAAMQNNILSMDALLNVAIASAEDFGRLTFPTEVQRLRQRDAFLRDIARVAHCIKNEEDSVHFLRAVHDHI